MWMVGTDSSCASSIARVVLPEPLGPSMATSRVIPQRGSLLATSATSAASRSALWSLDIAPTLEGYARRVSVATRVIPCLDVDAGRVVKGVRFENLRDAGDPVELATAYGAQGADELTFLDVTASSGNRETTYDVVRRTAEQVFIPLTVGGGVRSVEDVDRLLRAGADKVGVNTAAISRPELISEIADRFGSQVLVLSADVRRRRDESGTATGGFEVTTHGGRTRTGMDAIEWCVRAADLGAGEILLNSMDADGTKNGFDLELIRLVRRELDVPLVASGGAGAIEHFAPAVTAGADAVLAASVFHFGELSVSAVKDAMRAAGVTIR
jgi:cyclase